MPAAIRVADAGMRGAFGKPYGKVARVDIGQVSGYSARSRSL